MASGGYRWETEPSPDAPVNPRVAVRPKRNKENRSRRMKKKLRVNEGTAVNNYFTETRETDSCENVPQFQAFTPEPSSEVNSSETRSLLKKSDLDYNFVYLEFKDSKLDLKFQKYLSCYHSFYTVLSWVVLPYSLLNISIFSVNASTFFRSNTLAIVICSLLQILNLILLAAYFYNIYSIRSELRRKIDSCHQYDELQRMEIASSPHFQHSLFQEISKYDDQQALSDGKAILLGRLASALATSTLMMIAAWSMLMAVYSDCPGLCVNKVPAFGVFFLWIIPFHFSVFTSIRGIPVFLLEVISKFLTYCAFSIQLNENEISTNFIVYVIATILVWIGFWLPVLYSWNHQQILHFHDIEAFRRVVAHYESDKRPIEPCFDIFDRVESPNAMNVEGSTNIRFSTQIEDFPPRPAEADRHQINALERDDDECLV